MKYCCDINVDNYSQRNNQYFRRNGESVANCHTTCNVTAMVEGLHLSGYKFPQGQFEQPEDNLMDFIINDPVIDQRYKQIYPAMYNDYKTGKPNCYWPNEVHALLCEGTNRWMGTNCVRFLDNLKIWDYLKQNFTESTVSLPIVVSGCFPKSNGSSLNHIVLITGVEIIDDEVTKVKWDDPYGNTLKDFVGSGNDVWVSRKFAEANLKPLGSKNIKWAHVFKKAAPVI